LLKRLLPAKFLAVLDGLFQYTGAFWQFTPSVFVRAKVSGEDRQREIPLDVLNLFKCPQCGAENLQEKKRSCLLSILQYALGNPRWDL
jgi:hypothetical protein